MRLTSSFLSPRTRTDAHWGCCVAAGRYRRSQSWARASFRIVLGCFVEFSDMLLIVNIHRNVMVSFVLNEYCAARSPGFILQLHAGVVNQMS